MSDKNLLCLVLTFALALFSIGNAFRAGNYILGFETLIIWFVIYSIMPFAMIIDRKTDYEKAPVDLKAILYRTVQNYYIFISFCASLLLSILFDDLVNYTGHFVKDVPEMDLPAISVLVFVSALFSLVFYMIFSKNRIEKLKNSGIKVDASVSSIKIFNNVCYIKASALHPKTGEKIELVGRTYTDNKENIPKLLPVYFNDKELEDYYFDCCGWLV